MTRVFSLLIFQISEAKLTKSDETAEIISAFLIVICCIYHNNLSLRLKLPKGLIRPSCLLKNHPCRRNKKGVFLIKEYQNPTRK